MIKNILFKPSWIAVVLYLILTATISFTVGTYSYDFGARAGFTDGANWMVNLMAGLRGQKTK